MVPPPQRPPAPPSGGCGGNGNGGGLQHVSMTRCRRLPCPPRRSPYGRRRRPLGC